MQEEVLKMDGYLHFFSNIVKLCVACSQPPRLPADFNLETGTDLQNGA